MIWIADEAASRSAEKASSHTALRTVEENPQSKPQRRAVAPLGKTESRFIPPVRNPSDNATVAGYCPSDPGGRRHLRTASTIKDAVANDATSMGTMKLSSEIKPTLEITEPIAVR